MPTLFCCILNCETDSVSSKKRKIFYRLPQNVERKQLWLNNIGERIKYGTISSNSRICNAHFATGKPNHDSNHVDHIPTIFPWSSKEDKTKSFQAVENYEAKIKELEQKILAKAFLTASGDSKLVPGFEVTTLESEEHSRLKLNSDPDQRSSLKKMKIDANLSNVSQTAEMSQTAVPVAGRSPSGEPGNSFSLNHNLLNYLINSITQANMVYSAELGQPEASGGPSVTLNNALLAAPLNLSQSFTKLEEHYLPAEFSKVELAHGSQMKTQTPSESVNPTDQNGQVYSIQKKLLVTTQDPVAPTAGSTEETNTRSCTCTKSSCLKLYCECFANGNLCSSGCTCINCRNNNDHKEERAKIVSSYLERDPWVFNSKIVLQDSQEFGKKHTKGCNCLKSSCLKNYCECFENKVFCSSLCRCRLCYNNEDHARQNNHKEEPKIYTASHTSDSLSILSENSPKDPGRKRKKSVVKSSEIYEDVSSNESGDEHGNKRRQTATEVPLADSGRSITSMDIPPVLPQEDDFTEEELALMLKFREQRSVKVESVTPPIVTQISQSIPTNVVNNSIANGPVLNTPISSSLINMPTQYDPNLLMSISKTLGIANLGLDAVSRVDNHQDINRFCGSDLVNLLVTQQLMVSRQSPLSPNYSHVVPINLAQMSSSQNYHTSPNSVPAPMVTSARPITTSIPTTINCPQPRVKLSTEDYVRRHIEAAEKAVRADNMRRDCIGAKKVITKQKIKIDNLHSPQKTSPSTISYGKEASSVSTSIQAHNSTKQDVEDGVNLNGSTVSGVLNGYLSEVSTSTTSSQYTNKSPTFPGTCSWVNGTSLQSNCSPTFTQAVNRMHNSSNKRGQDTFKLAVESYKGTSTYNRKWRDKYKSLRRSLHNMRTELRSIKVHMRADQSKIRRLESALLHMSNELHK